MCGFIYRLFAMAATEKALSEKYLLCTGKYVGMGHLHTHYLFCWHGAERRIIDPDFYLWCVTVWVNHRWNTYVDIEK